MYSILIISDNGVPSGFGRIADELGIRLQARGFRVMAASFRYDGLLPVQYANKPLPYHVASLDGRSNWAEACARIIGATNPDIVCVIQDMPYVQQMRAQRIDWSQYKFMAISPVDGDPIYPEWITCMAQADIRMTISQFGVDAYARAGVPVSLCQPAIDTSIFRPALNAAEFSDIRTALGLSPNDFLLGTMCQNQGRKLVPIMLETFFKFAEGKPNAYYLLDAALKSPAGWDIRALCQQFGWNMDKLITSDKINVPLPERYRALSAFMLLSSREGFGLPLIEAQASGVPVMTLDYCSGPEIAGDGKGVVIPCDAFYNYSGWGGAIDRYPDRTFLRYTLEDMYANPAKRMMLGKAGYEAASQLNWDTTANAVVRLIGAVCA